jgi:hypothetical protein
MHRSERKTGGERRGVHRPLGSLEPYDTIMRERSVNAFCSRRILD